MTLYSIVGEKNSVTNNKQKYQLKIKECIFNRAYGFKYT